MANQEVVQSKDTEMEEGICRAIRADARSIHVVVNDGDVGLSGDADDFEMKRNVFSTVEKIPGVRYVIDHIRVLPKNQVRIPWDEKSPEAEAFRMLLKSSR